MYRKTLIDDLEREKVLFYAVLDKVMDEINTAQQNLLLIQLSCRQGRNIDDRPACRTRLTEFDKHIHLASILADKATMFSTNLERMIGEVNKENTKLVFDVLIKMYDDLALTTYWIEDLDTKYEMTLNKYSVRKKNMTAFGDECFMRDGNYI